MLWSILVSGSGRVRAQSVTYLPYIQLATGMSGIRSGISAPQVQYSFVSFRLRRLNMPSPSEGFPSILFHDFWGGDQSRSHSLSLYSADADMSDGSG
ncbi:hypothetical protein F5X98DRAFT_346029 [Xylaria grammica]|nr:hypothetical protein F5X98DRAFT_346029 [Xylaria grammica]